MILLVLIILLIGAAIVVPKFIPDSIKKKDQYNNEVGEKSLNFIKWIIRSVFVGLAIICFLMTSCLVIDSNKVGHLKRIYFGDEMPQGRIIAAPNQKGPQAKILAPGFHLIPFIAVTHDVEELPIVSIKAGQYGFLVAKDGKSMPPGQFIAPAWDSADNMIDAMKFMGYDFGDETPKGIKGPQLTVLPPGDYRINRYLFNIFGDDSTPVPAGYVAVIKSNVGDDYAGDPILPTGIDASNLSVPIVPKGYRGVWADVKTPGEYYINKKAYEVTMIDTRVQTWQYIGGYTRKWIDLTVDESGKIHQDAHEEIVPILEGSADAAVILRVDGWDVFQDSRVQVQVTPENAPFVVASVGGLKQVEDKIITPNYRSILRNVVAQVVTVTEPLLDADGNTVFEKVFVDGKEVKGAKGEPKMHTVTRPRQVLDLLYHRQEIEQEVLKKLIPTGRMAGLTIQWVRFGDPSVPPSLLIPGKRKQLAESLMATYKQEKLAQGERVETEKEKARADQQAELMKSEIGIKVADNKALAREKEGLGQQKYLEAVAKGQLAQAMVLGKDKAFELAYVKEVLAAASKNPQMIKVPSVLVMGSGSSLEGAAAILGANNITMGLKPMTNAKAKQ